MILLLFFWNPTFSRTDSLKRPTERKGLGIGIGIGAGAIQLKTNGSPNIQFSPTIPNFKFGYMLNNNLELVILLPGAIYTYQNKTRGFEAFTIGAQYWLKKRWSLLGSVGPTFDAPAFYTVDEPENARFYFGFPAAVLSTSYELWRKNKFSIDIQYRLFYGRSSLPDGQHREGISNTCIIGLNWL